MDRFLLTVGLILVILLAAWGLRVGWKHRAQRQADIADLPPAPVDLGAELTEPLSGLYVSSTPTGSWQDRIVAHGLGRRAAATLHLSPLGVLIERVGESEIFIPVDDLVAVGTAPGIAGKVMGMPDGILVITWRLGGSSIDSGLRLEDLEDQAEWIAAAKRLLGEPTTSNDGASA
ncbi:transporter [Nakamurella sp. PAMC28650]|jgi:hypothetical protein|uniref:PH-like domain-containing protein n=1 Tax=Nakamurella sp. PAMC28650 TaxID=2762325 RepID=UPI00164E7D53|nr:transporter [Nakamurella sp. PAMC28650]QNK80853.1 transporter [Nakamurella sp. PAMC28650]